LIHNEIYLDDIHNAGVNLHPVSQPGTQLRGEYVSNATPGCHKLTATSRKTQRIPALDFTKGALVLIMVVYHWLNYFYGPHDSRYLRFLTPSFIFITGFLISNVYLSKYDILSPKLPKRLIERGLKILGVFLLLNLARNFLAPAGSPEQVSSAGSTVRNLINIYIMGSGVGTGQSKAVAFFILVPIGYLLIFSALLVIVTRFYRHAFSIACLFCLVCTLAMSFEGIESPNLQLLTIGLLGVTAGYLPIEKVNVIVRCPYPYLLAALYVLYLGAITVWNVVYWLQIVGVYLSLMIIYVLGQQNGEPGKARAYILLLGKYSLVGYIAQIAILQLLHLGLGHINIDSEALVLVLSFVLAVVLTIASVEVLDRTRARSTNVDRLYKAVFA
jgi:hypothetical protein